MWILRLNHMQSPNVENLTTVACAETREALMTFLDRERVDFYRDGHWNKAFRAGGPLEWYNPPYINSGHDTCVNIGTEEDWRQQAADQFHSLVNGVPRV